MKRVVALVVAAGMVVVAIVVRGAIDDDDGGASGSLRLVCATELRDACEEMDVDVTIEDAGTTFAMLIDPATTSQSFGFDGWLTLSPWPAMVDETRARAGLAPVLGSSTAPIARSPLVLAVRTNRTEVLTDACGGTIEWRCLGDLAGTPWEELGGQRSWGAVRAGHADPVAGAVGLDVLGQATTEFFDDRTDLVPLDLDTGGFYTWLNRLEDSGSLPSFTDFLTRPGFDAVGTTEAEAGPRLAAASPDIREDVTLLYLEPVVTADVVFAVTAGGSDAGESLEREVTGDDAREALAETGWRVDGQGEADGVRTDPELPGVSGLPSPGLLLTLQQRWQEVVR